MNIVTSPGSFFTGTVKISSHIIFIRAFVFAETNIPVDPEGTVFGPQVCNREIKCCNFFDHFIGEQNNILFGIFISRAIRFEPVPVVVFCKEDKNFKVVD
jgi:hypothetical protein